MSSHWIQWAGSTGQKNLNAFTISYTASTPFIAQEVTSRLSTMFIQTI